MTPLTAEQRELAESLLPIAKTVAKRLIRSNGPLPKVSGRGKVRGNAAIADEIYSAAMLGVVKAAAGRDEGHTGLAWTCAVNAVKNALRSERRKSPATESIEAIEDIDAGLMDRGLDAIDAEDEAEFLLSILPGPVSDALYLLHIEGLNQAEAADRMGVSQASIWRYTCQARQILAREADACR